MQAVEEGLRGVRSLKTPSGVRARATWKVHQRSPSGHPSACRGGGGRLRGRGLGKSNLPGRPGRSVGEGAAPKLPLSPHAAPTGAQGEWAPPRCAGGWAGVWKVRRPRPGPVPPGLPPRESESVAPAEVARWGRGRHGPGSGRRAPRGHGWARPPPPSQPEAEARPLGLVLPGRVRARARARGRPGDCRPGREATGAGVSRGCRGSRSIGEQSGGHSGAWTGSGQLEGKGRR